MTPASPYSAIPDSPLSRWDARWKLAAIIPAAFGVASINHLAPCAAALAIGLLLLCLARLSHRWIRRRLWLFAFATLPFLIVLPFTLDPTGPGWELGPLHISEHGIGSGLAVFCRCMAIGCLALLILGTAPFHHTLAALHKLMVPGLLVLLVGLSYRYAFLLVDELRRIRIALRTRGFRNRASRHGYRTLAYATGAVLVLGADRAERVTAAMHCRGFAGTFRTTIIFRTTTLDVLFFLASIVIIAAMIAWDWGM